MGKPVTSNVERAEATVLNTKINKEVFEAFKDCCKELGYPMNVMLETFMSQYANGRFEIQEEDILKFKNDGAEEGVLNTTVSKEVHTNFKYACKFKGYFVRYVITAFMEKFVNKGLILEYVDIIKE